MAIKGVSSRHPQEAIHASSLIQNGVDGPDDNAAQQFWINASRGLKWFQRPSIAYGPSSQTGKDTWFPDGVLNTCYEALDRHCEPTPGNKQPGDRACIHHVSLMPQAKLQPYRTLTYNDVLRDVQILAGVLRHRLGVVKGDRVVIYMSMVPECAIAMLACARIGAIHSVVFGGFAPRELAKRINDAQPKALLATSCGIEPRGVIDYKPLLDSAIKQAEHPPSSLLLLRRTHITGHTSQEVNSNASIAQEFDWAQESTMLPEHHRVKDCEPVNSDDPLYTLYTSGTTAMPKGVVRQSGGHAVALRYSMEHVFGLEKTDTMFTASDLGWVVGHSYILYAPLLRGCATIVFEGKPIIPDGGVLWSVIERFGATALFTAPTALRAVSRSDPSASLMRRHNLRTLRAIFLAGERSEPTIIKKMQRLLSELGADGAIMNDNYWSTETGSPITAIAMNSVFHPLHPRPGSAGKPMPGMDVRVVNDEGVEIETGELGNIVLKPPLGPSALSGLWRNEERYQEAYFERFKNQGWFDTGDAGMIDQDGYVHVLSRVDDVMNVAGHRLSTSLLEQVISGHDLIAECCVVGMPHDMKGHVPFALVTPAISKEAQSLSPEKLLAEVNGLIRADVGAIAALESLVIGNLPKTRSGKTLRRTIRSIVEACSQGKYDVKPSYPPTVEDVNVVQEAVVSIASYFKNKKISAKL